MVDDSKKGLDEEEGDNDRSEECVRATIYLLFVSYAMGFGKGGSTE